MSDSLSGPSDARPAPSVAHEAPGQSQKNGKKDPKLRHEFVGMMFAVAIGEVGLQTATLVRAGNWVHFLPAYSHLLLATMIIATSWVGWTLSHSRGGQKDVESIFEWEFMVLLLDVALVIIYFILVRSVDIVGDDPVRLSASARPEVFWILIIFWIYFVWDFPTKWPLSRPENLVRVVATGTCLVLAYVVRSFVQDADPPHVLTADLALLSLVLLFRALKDLASAFYPGKTLAQDELRRKKKRAIFWSAFFAAGVILGTVWTCCGPLPEGVVRAIQTTPSN